jgi:hypothetical protein
MGEITKATPDDAGTWREGSSTRTADELNAVIVQDALDRGMPALSEESAETLKTFNASDERWADGDEGDWLSHMADQAIGWLSNEVAPEGYHFCRDDGLIMHADEECDGI